MAHAEGVVGGVLGEEGGEIGVGWWGVGVEKDAGCGDGEDGAEDEEDESATLRGAGGGAERTSQKRDVGHSGWWRLDELEESHGRARRR